MPILTLLVIREQLKDTMVLFADSFLNIETWCNSLPRKILAYHTPDEIFERELGRIRCDRPIIPWKLVAPSFNINYLLERIFIDILTFRNKSTNKFLQHCHYHKKYWMSIAKQSFGYFF